MYVAEIIPPAASAVEEFESKYVEEENENKGFSLGRTYEIFGKDIEFGMLKGPIQRACFQGLKKDIDYSVKVSTVVNGKTISEVCEDIEEEHETETDETTEAEAVINHVEMETSAAA